MKKRLIITAVTVFITATLLLYLGVLLGTPHKGGYFQLEDYLDQIRSPEFQSFETYGILARSEHALQAAKLLFAERFSYEPKISIIDPVGWEILQDEDSGAWLVRSYKVLPFTEGGVYTVIFSSGGTVLAVWGEK